MLDVSAIFILQFGYPLRLWSHAIESVKKIKFGIRRFLCASRNNSTPKKAISIYSCIRQSNNFYRRWKIISFYLWYACSEWSTYWISNKSCNLPVHGKRCRHVVILWNDCKSISTHCKYNIIESPIFIQYSNHMQTNGIIFNMISHTVRYCECKTFCYSIAKNSLSTQIYFRLKIKLHHSIFNVWNNRKLVQLTINQIFYTLFALWRLTLTDCCLNEQTNSCLCPSLTSL